MESIGGKDLFIKGKRISLRKIKISDVNKTYLGWMRDPEVTRFLENGSENWTIKKLKSFVSGVNRNPNYFFWAIIHHDSGRHIGNIKLGPVNRFHHFGDIGLTIGEKSFWRQGLGTEAIKLVKDYAFRKLRLNKLTAGAFCSNIGSIKGFKKAGFYIEGRRKRYYFYNGGYVDSILMGCLKKP